jgi:hypothetical protein
MFPISLQVGLGVQNLLLIANVFITWSPIVGSIELMLTIILITVDVVQG